MPPRFGEKLKKKADPPLCAEVQPPQSSRLKIALVLIALNLVTLIVYRQVAHADFFVLDDPVYVTQNPHVNSGFSVENVHWAFTERLNANYHPITTISHMLDVQLFGLNPGPHHLVNLAVHMVSASVLFLAIFQMTKRLWRSVFVAAVFALHPQHVESVAWIAERKDVLSGLFFMLCLLTYGLYVKKRTAWRYAAVLVLYAIGLLSKPMLVSVPLVLLLLDYWPLKRTESFGNLLVEKIPLAILAGVSCVITIVTQSAAGAVSVWMPIPLRFGNAAVSIVRYVGAAFGPIELSMFYPLVEWPMGILLAGCLSFLLITLIIVLFRREHPEWLVGWMWFLVMLVPVLGLVQVGEQSIADRYMYLPSIGLSLLAIWFIADLLEKSGRQTLTGIIAAAVLLAMALRSQAQVEQWQTSEGNLLASINTVGPASFITQRLGVYLWSHDRRDEAMDVFRAMSQTDPTDPHPYQAMGEMLKRDRRPQEAEQYYMMALQRDPRSVKTLLDLADAFQMHADYDRAIDAAQHAVDIAPDNEEARAFLEELKQDQAKNAKR
jgi:hypothetical protein